MAYCVHPAEDVEQQLVAPLLNNGICERFERGEERRAWEDLCPHLLNSIYAKLPTHVEGTEFGSVCQNWRQVHCTAALSTPLPLTVEKPLSFTRIISSSKDNVIQFDDYAIQSVVTKTKSRTTKSESRMWTGRIPIRLAFSRKTIVGSAGAWWLLVQEEGESGRGNIDWCFNPLLRSPANLIALPKLSTCPLLATHYDASKVKAAFSALPTARDWAIMVVHPPRRLSTLRSGHRLWRCYKFGGGDGELDCIGIGYGDGKFFCLFENGELLIFSVEEDGGECRMLTPGSRRPLLPGNLHRVDNYLRVADNESGFLRVSWGRVDEREGSFRLLTVERETAAEPGNDEAPARLEEGQRAGVVYLNAQIPIQRRWGRNFVTRYYVPLVLVLGFMICGFLEFTVLAKYYGLL